MKSVFKTSRKSDGTEILWFSHRGRLLKIATYSQEMQDACTPEDLIALMERDGRIFLKGFDVR